MTRFLHLLLCCLLMLAIFCPGLCLAKMKGAESHSCCPKPGSVPSSDCSHSPVAQKADGPVLLDYFAVPPASDRTSEQQLRSSTFRSSESRPLFSPPPPFRSLVLRI